MSIVVNSLINDAFQKCSLVGDGQSASGTMAVNALKDLISVIAYLNEQNLVLSDVETADVHCNGHIRVMESLPEDWYELDEWPSDLTNYRPGCVLKVGNEFRTVRVEGQIRYTVPMNGFDKWPDLIISPLPDRIQALSRKLGNRFVQLYPAERQLLDSHTKQTLPTFYTAETQLESVKVIDREYNYEVYIIDTDSHIPLHYRITYLKKIPNYKLNDRLYYSERVLSIIEDGLCAKLCLRYKLTDIKPLFDEEFENGVRLLKRSNQSNRPMTYQENGGGFMDAYFDAFAPRSW